MLSPLEYTQSEYKRQWIRRETMFQKHFRDPSCFLIGVALCYKIKFWILIFCLTQIIYSGNVSTSWCWCQVLFILSCPPGTRKSILHPQAVRGEEKHWPLILSWSTSFSALWFISCPGLKWASNTNVYLVYPFCLCHQLIFFSPDIL